MLSHIGTARKDRLKISGSQVDALKSKQAWIRPRRSPSAASSSWMKPICPACFSFIFVSHSMKWEWGLVKPCLKLLMRFVRCSGWTPRHCDRLMKSCRKLRLIQKGKGADINTKTRGLTKTSMSLYLTCCRITTSKATSRGTLFRGKKRRELRFSPIQFL